MSDMILHFVGKPGEYVNGVPARDLTHEDLESAAFVLGVETVEQAVEQLLYSGSYSKAEAKAKKAPKKKAKKEPAAEPVESFVCTKCEEEFANWHDLHEHVESTH
jgi:DNA-directed RNA polymerase subunit M/transcription elongation factor TFIIS